MTEPGAVRTLLGGRLRLLFEGSAGGDASVRSPELAARLASGRAALGADGVVLMQLAFAQRVARRSELEASPLATGVERYPRPADGYLLTRPNRAAAFANGDCALGVVVTPDAAAAVVMHLGLGCLYRREPGPTLVEQAVACLVEHSGWTANRLSAWVGCAIGPCCHGYDHTVDALRVRGEALAATWGVGVVGGRVERGPRRGQVAYDHAAIAERAFGRAGIGGVERDPRCTACAGIDPERDGPPWPDGDYFSNTRDQARSVPQQTRARNLAMVALGAPP